jgi:hypothetical protein
MRTHPGQRRPITHLTPSKRLAAHDSTHLVDDRGDMNLGMGIHTSGDSTSLFCDAGQIVSFLTPRGWGWGHPVRRRHGQDTSQASRQAPIKSRPSRTGWLSVSSRRLRSAVRIQDTPSRRSVTPRARPEPTARHAQHHAPNPQTPTRHAEHQSRSIIDRLRSAHRTNHVPILQEVSHPSLFRLPGRMNTAHRARGVRCLQGLWSIKLFLLKSARSQLQALVA